MNWNQDWNNFTGNTIYQKFLQSINNNIGKIPD